MPIKLKMSVAIDWISQTYSLGFIKLFLLNTEDFKNRTLEIAISQYLQKEIFYV